VASLLSSHYLYTVLPKYQNSYEGLLWGKPKRRLEAIHGSRSSSSLLLLIKKILGNLDVSGRRLSLPFFPNPRVNWFMVAPKSLALPHIQIILQNNTMISKTAGAVLINISSVICAVPASNFLNNVLGTLFTQTLFGQHHVCATLFDNDS